MSIDHGKLLKSLVREMLNKGASDIHLSPSIPPRFRVNGSLVDATDTALSDSDTKAIMNLLASPDQRNEVVGTLGDTDFACFLEEQRFRGNVSRTQGGVVIALRYLPNRIPEMHELGLPVNVIKEMLHREGGGIILVTGPTGSGKSTTLASMVDYINNLMPVHIITIEAPVEYIHQHKKASVNQREMPMDTPSFASAIRASLRQDPDVILVGEMRDLETISAAITAAETGHLVFATLHTISASETVNRIIDAFPTNQQDQIRAQLSTSLMSVISQRLLVRADGRGRVAAFEIMINNSAIANLIREGKAFRIPSVIQTNGKIGMVTFDAYLKMLLARGLITMETALKFSHNPESF